MRVQIHPPICQKYLFGRAFTSCGYKKDIRSKNRAVARFFDAQKAGFLKCRNTDISKRKIDSNPHNDRIGREIHSRSLEVSPHKQATGLFIFKRKTLIIIKITAKYCLFPSRVLPNSDKSFKSIFSGYFFGFGLDFSKSCGILVVKKNSKKG